MIRCATAVPLHAEHSCCCRYSARTLIPAGDLPAPPAYTHIHHATVACRARRHGFLPGRPRAPSPSSVLRAGQGCVVWCMWFELRQVVRAGRLPGMGICTVSSCHVIATTYLRMFSRPSRHWPFCARLSRRQLRGARVPLCAKFHRLCRAVALCEAAATVTLQPILLRVSHLSAIDLHVERKAQTRRVTTLKGLLGKVCSDTGVRVMGTPRSHT